MANALGKLRNVLRSEPYRAVVPRHLDLLEKLQEGSPVPALQLLNACAFQASAVLAKFLMQKSAQPLLSATDLGFTEEMWVPLPSRLLACAASRTI